MVEEAELPLTDLNTQGKTRRGGEGGVSLSHLGFVFALHHNTKDFQQNRTFSSSHKLKKSLRQNQGEWWWGRGTYKSLGRARGCALEALKPPLFPTLKTRNHEKGVPILPLPPPPPTLNPVLLSLKKAICVKKESNIEYTLSSCK